MAFGVVSAAASELVVILAVLLSLAPYSITSLVRKGKR
jgi:hypothetical protein